MNPRTIVAVLLAAALAGVAMLLVDFISPAGADDRHGGAEGSGMDGKKLTADEERVIVHKGTEMPFTGKYWKTHDSGTYQCKRCGVPLFPSTAKFESGTGWPSFDSALPDAVKEIPDADGMRTEIVCAKCGAHLGHVFKGEGFTSRNTRNCVNSISLDFVPDAATDGATPAAGAARTSPPPGVALAGTCANPDTPKTADAYFAGGCFWGVEYFLDKAPGVITAESGYMGGRVEKPTYEQVSNHETGHAETVHVVYDPSKTTYEALAKLFFDIHDPTQVGRQGPDIGDQYRSVVFYTDEDQKNVVESLIGRLQRRGLRVATRLVPAGTFWPAEGYHQDYYQHKGGTPYCHVKEDRFGDQ
jgi:peptide methionine sulfoxide reductase msrA/msrB